MSRCIVCGQRPPEPANLLDVCTQCVDLLDGYDAEHPDVDPHAHPRERYPLVVGRTA